ncbi:hypothetical protein [uncultured Bilophila sp.]|uniref:hypothetical protein n=1 Tax=uncultured Bilophila sp. TaxID=529385 RepID=UPI00280ACA92|nr:hypothetical protein [uncultured Bilophila sp.]
MFIQVSSPVATTFPPERQAANYPFINQLRLSPQCGFASTEEGNLLTEKEQWAKIAFIKEIAESIWK